MSIDGTSIIRGIARRKTTLAHHHLAKSTHHTQDRTVLPTAIFKGNVFAYQDR